MLSYTCSPQEQCSIKNEVLSSSFTQTVLSFSQNHTDTTIISLKVETGKKYTTKRCYIFLKLMQLLKRTTNAQSPCSIDSHSLQEMYTHSLAFYLFLFHSFIYLTFLSTMFKLHICVEWNDGMK
jgi:hypothetical protein